MKRPKKKYQIGDEETTESKVILPASESETEDILIEEEEEIIKRYEIDETKGDEVLTETIKIKRPKKKAPKYEVKEEEDIEVGVTLRKKPEEQPESGDVESSVVLKRKSPEAEETIKETSPLDTEGEFTFEVPKKQKIKKTTQEVETAETLKLPKRPTTVPNIKQEHVEIAPPLDVKPGDRLRAIATYLVEDEHDNTMHLIEGERVYVQECSNDDWWFVEKHLTKEKGFVPAKLLAEEQTYNLFVQKRLEEKIKKLPVFEKLKKGEKAKAPKILEKIQPKVVVDGQEVQFVCKVEGMPKPNITWFRQTAIIKPSEEFQTFYTDDGVTTLFIKEVFPEDAGMFTCVAKNEVGAAATSAELVVEGPMSDHGSDSVTASRRSLSRESSVCDILEGIPPTFAHKGITKTTEEGVTVEMDVRLVAIPEPEITWKKDGQVVTDSNRIRIVKQKDVHAYRSIVIIKGTKKDDQGVYEVTAKNREGEAKNTVTLTVKAPAPPEFPDKLKDQTVEEEGTIRLVSRVKGNPLPDVTWSSTFKKGLESCVVKEHSEVVLECRTTKEVKNCKWLKDKKRVKEERTRVIIEQESLTHRLTISPVLITDAGQYKCVFDDQSTFCNLTVKDFEEFTTRLQDLEVTEKEKAVFEVEVSNERSEVTWHKDGKEITPANDKFDIVKDGRKRKLILKSATLRDEGEYTCCMGDLETSAELGVRELPAEIVRKMKDQLVYKGAKATFEVELTKGDAVITWFKNDEEIRFSDHHQLSIDGKVQRLMVYNCQLDDAGFYRAVVGRSECSAVLTVELQEEGDFLKKLQSELDVTSGSEVTFTVQITKPEYDVQWLRNGEKIKPSDRFIIEKDGNKRTLILKSVKKDDAADYTCTLGKLLKTTCKLNVLVMETPPTVDKSQIQLEYVVKKGTDVTFTVPFKGTPTPKATWYHKGKPVNVDNTRKYLPKIDENSASITVKQVQNIDCGEYRLELKNDCGDTSVDISLKILDKPSKPGWPEILKVTNESVSIHWRAPDDDGGRKITNYIVEYKTKLTRVWEKFNKTTKITETTTVVTSLKKDKEYCFRVSAVNEIGTSDPSEESQYVKVCEPIKPEPPTVLEQLQPVVTGLHQTVVLRCVISGTPEPKIEWTKDKQVITSNTTYEKFTATLTIKETSGSSAGMYTCKATNEAGVNECSAPVVIQEAPRFEFDESLQAQVLYVGDKWHIPIKVTGYPQPKITWTRNDKPIKPSDRVVIHTEEEEGLTDIAIQKIHMDDSAVFTLTAQNSASKSTLSFNLRVVEEDKVEEKEEIIEEKEEVKHERPGPPNGPLKITEVTSISVRLTWKKSSYDGGSEITSHYIEKLEKGQKQWQKVDEVGANITSYITQNLNEGREYFFRVFALNAIGLSDALESDSVFIKSPIDVPGPPVGPFDVNIVADSSLEIQWQPPKSDGGAPITGYFVERREAFKKAWQKVGQTAAEVTKIEITGLKRGVSYFFRVFAINEVGQGPPLQPDEPITAGKNITVPSMPTGLNVLDVTSRTVTLGWAPPATTGGADLIGYVIQRRLTSEDKWQNVRTVDPSVTLFCIEHLTEKSEYEFRVFAENPIGLSEQAARTEHVKLKTHATPPSPPTAPLEARPTGPTSLMIEWGAPESDGGAPLLGYTIAIRDTKRSMWIEVGQVDANFTRLHIKELQENHEYNVRVFARNEVGTSEPLETEDPVQIIRPDDFTELPEDDAAPSLSYSTTETLSWMREAGVDADIYSYARGRLLNRDEYFFKLWHKQQKPFKE